MRKAHFMDKHPIRTSASMRKAHFMDKHQIRTSVSMRKAHFMDEHPDPGLGVHDKGSFNGVNFPFLRQALKRSVCSAISSSRTPSSK